jgi:FKBP-type peptidyl-prolyl cis-trans isomerase FkpA
MKQAYYVLLLAAAVMTGCGGGFKKTDKGTEYKIIAKGSGDTLKYGDIFEFSYEMRYQHGSTDSLLSSSEMASNSMAMLDTVNTPKYIYEIFKQCRKGDSIVLKVSVDSNYNAGNPMPEMFKKGSFFVSKYRIVNVYKDKAAADSVFGQLRIAAQQKAIAREKELLVKDDKTIADYLAKNKITAEKGPKGTYVQIIQPGTGPLIDTTVEAKINYTGRGLNSSKAFDSNTDTAFHHVGPIGVQMWAPMVIPGWLDGLGKLSKGAKAKFYIPSGLGYGAQGAGNDIKPNEILVFDIEVVDVLSKAQAMALAAAEQKRMEAEQKKYMAEQKRIQDSIAKASKAMAKDSAKNAK